MTANYAQPAHRAESAPATFAALADQFVAVAIPEHINEDQDTRAYDYWRGYRAARDECVEVLRAAPSDHSSTLANVKADAWDAAIKAAIDAHGTACWNTYTVPPNPYRTTEGADHE